MSIFGDVIEAHSPNFEETFKKNEGFPRVTIDCMLTRWNIEQFHKISALLSSNFNRSIVYIENLECRPLWLDDLLEWIRDKTSVKYLDIKMTNDEHLTERIFDAIFSENCTVCDVVFQWKETSSDVPSRIKQTYSLRNKNLKIMTILNIPAYIDFIPQMLDNRNGHSLKSIKIEPVSTVNAISIFQSLEDNITLQTLNLSKITMTPELTEKIRTTLIANETLTGLCLSNVEIANNEHYTDMITKINEALKFNAKLVTLDILSNQNNNNLIDKNINQICNEIQTELSHNKHFRPTTEMKRFRFLQRWSPKEHYKFPRSVKCVVEKIYDLMQSGNSPLPPEMWETEIVPMVVYQTIEEHKMKTNPSQNKRKLDHDKENESLRKKRKSNTYKRKHCKKIAFD